MVELRGWEREEGVWSQKDLELRSESTRSDPERGTSLVCASVSLPEQQGQAQIDLEG